LLYLLKKKYGGGKKHIGFCPLTFFSISFLLKVIYKLIFLCNFAGNRLNRGIAGTY